MAAGERQQFFAKQLGRFLQDHEIADQVVIAQIASEKDSDGDAHPTITEPTSVTPSLPGGGTEPDVRANLRLECFHPGGMAPKNADEAQATLRFTIGDDAGEDESQGQPLYWAIAAGLKLYDTARRKKIPAGELQADFVRPLQGRAAIIRGGAGLISFQLLQHPRQTLWEKVFTFVEGQEGQQLISVLGFPAIATEAVRFVDQVTGLFAHRATPLLTSAPLRLAFTQAAQSAIVGSADLGIAVGGLNSGHWVLAKASDLEHLKDAQAFYHHSYRRLVPTGQAKPDALDTITYAVLHAELSPLDPKNEV